MLTWSKDQTFWRPKLPQENAVFPGFALTASSCCLISVQALGITQPLRNAPRGKEIVNFVMKALWEGGGGLNWYRYVTLFSSATDCFFCLFFFHVMKSYMSNVNFSNLYLKICTEKVGQQFCWNRTSSISVYCWSNVKSHGGWSIFFCQLSENEWSEQVLENFRNGKTFRRQTIFPGNNFRRHYLFVGKYFRHLTKN